MAGKVAFVYHGTVTKDIRIRKELAFLSADFHVDLIEDHTAIRQNTFQKWLSMTCKIDYSAAKSIRAFLQESQPDVVTCQDLYLLPTVLREVLFLAKETKSAPIPVVADLHELYSVAIPLYAAWRPPMVRFLLSMTSHNGRSWQRVEQNFLPRCKGIVTVCPEAVVHYKQYAGSSIPMVVFGNKEPRSAVCPATPTPFRPPIRLVYFGSYGAHRGIADFCSYLAGASSPCEFHIIGKVPDRAADALRSLLSGSPASLVLHGFIPEEEALHRLKDMHYMVIPHLRNAHTDATLPHKLYQAFAMGLPSLVSDCPPLVREAMASKAAIVFRHDPSASETIRAALSVTESDYRTMSNNAIGYAKGDGALDEEYSDLKKLYSSLC